MAWVAPFDPFEALGLERNAAPQTIKSKYHELARRYHPNRNQGTDSSKAALSEYFHHVNQAWQLLGEPEKRRRYIELLDLYDLHETILANTADLLSTGDQPEQHGQRQRPGSDGHVSSDADDDDLPRIAGLRKRDTFDRLGRKPSATEDRTGNDDSDRNVSKEPKSRLRSYNARGRVDSGRDSDGNDQSVAAERRKKFDKLRRKELEAFTEYRDAMVDKFEAEEAAERCKELFERARWRREYFERAPRETSQRMKLIRLFHNATKAFTAQQLPVTRRKGSSVSQGGQILSTGDPLQNSPQSNQFLSLPSRTKSTRRKGFSSDISADQTSSDEEDNSSDKVTSPSRRTRAVSPAPNHKRHRSGDSIPTSLRLTPRRLPNASHDPISPITGPGPMLFIRAPTNLHEIAESQAENGATPPERSRSPSSEEKDDPDRGRFKLLPHFSTSEMFGSEREGRSRSVSADRRTPSINGNGLPRTQSPNAEATFRIKQVGQLQYHNIPVCNVHEMNEREKQWMLSVEPDEDSNPFDLLQRLARLDEAVAAKLTVKADIKNAFNFRLIYDHREINRSHHQSFIALSYRRKLLVKKQHKHYSLPLESEMFQAVWDERLSDKEGVWIDQICIDQDSDHEKNVSMSAMDMVYRSARLVVVALDDIELEAHEANILQNFMDEFNRQPSHIPANKRLRRRAKPYLETHYDLYTVFAKMLRSSWFKRAWCRHEMRLAREHIFLVPCRNPGSWSERSVLRFTGKCLTHFLGLATEVAFESSIEAVKPALYAFFRDRSKLSPEHHLRSHHGNFTTVVAEVFAMEAGGDPKVPDEQREADARKDKIAIILNTMECGLALKQGVRKAGFSLPTTECYYMLLLVALAARDPGALCSVGHPLQPLPYNLSSSWLLEPTNVDSGLNNYRTLDRLPSDCLVTTHCRNEEHYVQLDLKFVGGGKIVRPLNCHENLALARHFAEVCERRGFGRNRKRYLLNDKTANHLFGSMEDVYIQILVCLFECGPDWMSEVCQSYGVSRWKLDLQKAYDLLIAFKNTNGLWPEHAWNVEGAGFIIDFVNFLVIRGMPQRQTREPEDWRPICVLTPDGGKVLTFIPSGDIRVAVPVALLDSDYLHLARLWVMEPRGEYNPHLPPHYEEWTLRGKSVLFSDEAAGELLELDNGKIRSKQKVFGRSAE